MRSNLTILLLGLLDFVSRNIGLSGSKAKIRTEIVNHIQSYF